MPKDAEKPAFDPVDTKVSFPDLERGILKYWDEEDVFKRSIKHRAGGETYSFYDGPPFATGLPHYGHLLAGTIKDVIPRYQTMKGKIVERRFGWDCHGLPVEYEIEKEYNIGSKKDIEKMGTEAFNNLCRAAVMRYTKEWREAVLRMGRWVDMDWDYRTMDSEYMESIWWVVKTLHEKGLLYEGYKPMHVCPRCVTPLSNFEVTQGYKDISDKSLSAKFELVDEPNTYILAWTTTPWTLPGNLFLAVNPNENYVRVKYDNALYIVAEKLREGPFTFAMMEHEVVGKPFSGETLVGKHYKPLFPYFAEKYKNEFRVVAGDFVTTQEGTGIVHIAPGFGEDDFKIGQREKIEMLQHVTMDGHFTKEVIDFAGQEVKPKDDPSKTDQKIAEYLQKNGTRFGMYNYKHSYPHCWRCDSPLINYAASSWFVSIEKIKKDMLKANAETEWVPSHIRDGRFGKWLEGARDWAISRDRFWGTPLPIWRNQETGKVEVLGSRDELMMKNQKRFTKISIVRHAQSHGNVDQVYQGKVPGTDLTSDGKKQAAVTAKKLKQKEIPVSAIYASPLNRTKQTAEAISKEIGVKVVTDDRLTEVAFGDYEGKHINFDDLAFVKERRAHKLSKGQVESIYHFEGMETWDNVEIRAREFLNEILKNHRGEHIVIVTHADLVMNFTHIFTGQDKHKIVHQPYPALAEARTFYWDHDRNSAMDLHKEAIDDILWDAEKAKNKVDVMLVRHGQTDWNRDRICQGQEGDRPLTEDGKKQAEETAKKLKSEKFDAIVTSDLIRASETAKIISKILNVPIVEESELLRERSFGSWVGKNVDEILKQYPLRYKDGEFGLHPESSHGGERLDQFVARAQKAREHLIKNYAGKKLLIVSHGGMIMVMRTLIENVSLEDASQYAPKNGEAIEVVLKPQMKRIPDVLDCWFESGSMPYAQYHFPFEAVSDQRLAVSGTKKKLPATSYQLPPNFPADFIAEGLDQTRGWFYTLTVLAAALYKKPAFEHVIVNGIVLAEDGKKMSKRLKNYPEPLGVVEKHGADAIRFALMRSPAVRGEDLRFSERYVEENVRGVLLPLWNSYNFFVTYANAAGWTPPETFSLEDWKPTGDLLDEWIVSKTQELINTMTKELDQYDLSATCDQLTDSIDSLTNWYIRLNRRRFAGKGEEQTKAFDTLYRVLLTISQLLAPFAPFITEAMYLNLTNVPHGSIHMTDWPKSRKLTKEEEKTLSEMEATRIVVALGLSLRSEAKIKVRQPLASVTFALPPNEKTTVLTEIIKEELNVKEVKKESDVTHIADRIVQVDARKVGPRLGGKVQEIIQAAKAGKFAEKDGNLIVLDETLSSEEARIVYQGHEGKLVGCERGIVVTIDTTVSAELEAEGLARDLIRAVQSARKDAGLAFTDTIALQIDGMNEVVTAQKEMIERETRSKVQSNDGTEQTIEIDGKPVTIRFKKL